MAASSFRSSRKSKRRTRQREADWPSLPDEQLLQKRFRDLKLSIAGTSLEPYIERLYAELKHKGLQLRPHCWLAEEWFSPDGIPGIAIPFYLSHPRLRRLERRMMGEVEGGNTNWLMRILRHEAGHALDSAFRLRRRSDWRAVFGSAAEPYPHSYRPQPGSRAFVQHLGAWYAQSHPTEDFAETFAVWLKSGPRWRQTYRDWPAFKKLEYVDGLMRELKGRMPPVRRREVVDAVNTGRHTLAEHYRTKLDHYAPKQAHMMDHLIRRVFVSHPTRKPAAPLLRRHKNVIVRTVAMELEVSQYVVHQVMRLIVQRCATLALYIRGPQRETLDQLERLVRRIVRLHLAGVGGPHLL